jgi:hypothetical protein
MMIVFLIGFICGILLTIQWIAAGEDDSLTGFIIADDEFEKWGWSEAELQMFVNEADELCGEEDCGS